MIRIGIAILALSPIYSYARLLDYKCEPNGVTAWAKQKFDEKAFWKKAIQELDAAEEAEIREYREMLFEMKQADERSAFDARNGHPQPPRKIQAEIKKEDVEFKQFMRQTLEENLSNIRKCKYIAASKLQ